MIIQTKQSTNKTTHLGEINGISDFFLLHKLIPTLNYSELLWHQLQFDLVSKKYTLCNNVRIETYSKNFTECNSKCWLGATNDDWSDTSKHNEIPLLFIPGHELKETNRGDVLFLYIIIKTTFVTTTASWRKHAT